MTEATIFIKNINSKPIIEILSSEERILGLQFDCEYTQFNSTNNDVIGLDTWSAAGSPPVNSTDLTQKVIISYPNIDSVLTFENFAKDGRFRVCELPAPITGNLTNIKMIYFNENDPNDFTLQIDNVTVLIDNTIAESGADPYVSPIYGPAYKLPSKKAFYRFLGDSKSNFVVNAQVDKLPISASLDIQNFSKPLINNINHSDKVKKNLTDDGFYYRNFFIKNKTNKFVLDLENLLVIKGNQQISLVEQQTLNLDNVKIYVNNTFGHEKIIFPYPANEILKTITLETNTDKFGKVIMEFSIFVCPQIRNGVKINVSKPITKENSNGLLVCYQKTKSIKIPRLTYTKKMNSVVEKLERKLVTEEFRDYSPSGELVNKRKITFICA